LGKINKYSLSLHDLKVSGNEETVRKIQSVLDLYEVPLTVHLVFDMPLVPGSILSNFIILNSKNQKLEIVFHGLKHKCSRNVSKLLSFYHKYQAEYLDDSDELRDKTQDMFFNTTSFLDTNLGICPPCWIAHKKNKLFFKILDPIFIESLLFLSFSHKKVFSPVISLGSPNDRELFFLRKLARIIFILTQLFRKKYLRIAVHECDLDKENSMDFFSGIINKLKKRKAQAVLLKSLF
jgi:hypothetical protein